MLILLLFCISFGSTNSEDNSKKKKYKIEGRSKDISIDPSDQSFTSKGVSSVKYEDIEIEASKIKRDDDNGKIIAEGDIGYKQGKHSVVAKYIELDLDSKRAEVRDGRTKINNFFLAAKKIEAKFPEILIADNASVTTCSLEDPHFEIRAKKVYFYPDAKFIAYKGWIFIGNFRLFPVPMYASYVIDKSDERAPLFPRVSFDEAKGTLVTYGFDYKISKNEDMFGIPNVSSELLVNVEASQKRGLGFDTIRFNYSMLEKNKIKGKIEIKDWVQAESEGEIPTSGFDSSNIIDKAGDSGSSYKFNTEHEIETDLEVGKKSSGYLLGKSNTSIKYKFTNSDLIKNSLGNYLPTKNKREFHQTDISIDQKLLYIANLKYRFKNISSSKDTLKELLDIEDEKAENSARRVEHEVDTKTENYIKLSQSDPYLHSIEVERRRDRELRPERGREGKSKIDDLDNIFFNIKPLKLSINKKYAFKDTWRSRSSSFDLKKENYVSSDVVNDEFKVNLGSYRTWLIDHKYSFQKFFKRERKFSQSQEEKNDKDNLSERAERDYNSREERIHDIDLESYVSAEADFSSTVPIKSLNVIPKYVITLKKYYDLDNEIIKNSFNSYLDSISHSFEVALPFMVYNNSDRIYRTYDLAINIAPKYIFSIFQGASPKSHVDPLNKNRYLNTLDIYLGNIKIIDTFILDRNFHAIDKYLKDNTINNSLTLSINDVEVVKSSFAISNSKEIDDLFPNYEHSHQHTLKIGDLDIDFKYSYSKRFERDTIVKGKIDIETDIESYVGSLKAKGLKVEYENRFKNIFSVIRGTDTSRIRENKFDLSYDRTFEEVKRTYSANAIFINQYDEIKNEYRDNEISLSLLFEDRNAIEEKDIIDKDGKDIKSSNQDENRVDDSFDEETGRERLVTNYDSDEEIDRILRSDKNESEGNNKKRDVISLGTEEKKEKIDRDLTKFKLDLKLINDEGARSKLPELSFENYISTLKIVSLNFFFKFTRYFDVSYKYLAKRKDIFKNFEKNEQELKVSFSFGKRDYEWTPAFYMKDNIKDNRLESIYGSIKHSIHCTSIEFKLGKTKSRDNNFVWMFGFEISVNEFPEKAFGMDIREDKIENVKFGI